jgi:hypothetical protein
MTGIATAIGVGIAGIGAGLYESSQQQGISGQALGLAQNTQGEQMQSYQQLQQLMQNPGAFLSNPIFQGQLNQGLTGVSRTMAAQGYLGSGNEAAALEQYGQSQAGGALLSQEQLLASMSGTQTASSPASALSAASGANNAGFNQLGGVLASLGYASAQNPGGGGLLSFFGGGGGAPAAVNDATAGGVFSEGFIP